MVTFLFWNLNRKSLVTSVVRLARQHDVDLIMLAECTIPASELLAGLNRLPGRARFRPPDPHSLCERIAIFPRFSSRYLCLLHEGPGFTIRRLTLPARAEILLAVVHLPSKLHWSSESQSCECNVLAEEIRRAERRAQHARTILVGDFNMNPFESGMVAASGLHGMMTEGIARKRSRIVQGREYPYFYNAMWSRLGDKSPGPPGTYFYDAGEHVNYYWHTFDQVLIRPELLDGFAHHQLEVLTSDGPNSLLSKDELPDPKKFSDHLPLLFRVNF